jgi:hypothetical protein
MSFLLTRRKFFTSVFAGTLAFLMLPFHKIFSQKISHSVISHIGKDDSSTECHSKLLEIARTYGSEFGGIGILKSGLK